jgi:hypothetical protein
LTEIRPGAPASPPGHPDLDALADFDAGVLDPAESARLQAHVAGCARCRAVLAGVRDVPQLLRALPPVRMPADVEARILAALDAERHARRGAQRRGAQSRTQPPAQPGPAATAPARPVPSLDAVRRRRRWPLALAAASLVLVAGGVSATIALQGRHAAHTSSGSSAAEVLTTRPVPPRDAAALPAYDRQTVTRSPLLVSILNGEHGSLTSADTSTDAERLRSCQLGVARRVAGTGTIPAGLQHIRFEGRPAYLLAYRGAGRMVLVVVAERCSEADPAVLFSRPV